MAVQLTLAQIRLELWNDLGDLSCNWSDSTALDQYIEKAARERGATLPVSNAKEMRVIPIMSEIYALEHLYNNAINDVDVTMGGKTVELSQIVEALSAKLDRLRKDLQDELEDALSSVIPLNGRVTMKYTPAVKRQKVDIRQVERYGSDDDGY